MVRVLGNLTGLMEDLLKGDVNPDFFPHCISIFSDLLVLTASRAAVCAQDNGEKQRVSEANSMKTCFVK